MVLSNFITHLIRISGRPVVTAGVYSRVTLAASTHRSHLSSIPLLLHHRFLAPLFFAHVRLPDNGIVSTLSQTFRDVFIVELYSSFFPPPFPLENDCTPIVSEIDTTKYVSSETTRLRSGSRSFLSSIDLRYFHDITTNVFKVSTIFFTVQNGPVKHSSQYMFIRISSFPFFFFLFFSYLSDRGIAVKNQFILFKVPVSNDLEKFSISFSIRSKRYFTLS